MHHVSWLLDGHILRTSFSGQMSLEQIEVVGDQICEMLSCEDASPVHLLIDAAALKSLPRTPRALKATLKWLRNPAFGHIVLYSSRNATDNVLLTLSARAMGIDLDCVATETDALELLARIDPILPELLAIQGQG